MDNNIRKCKFSFRKNVMQMKKELNTNEQKNIYKFLMRLFKLNISLKK